MASESAQQKLIMVVNANVSEMCKDRFQLETNKHRSLCSNQHSTEKKILLNAVLKPFRTK